jgi:hypothetical protein
MVGGATPQYYISRRPRLHKNNQFGRQTEREKRELISSPPAPGLRLFLHFIPSTTWLVSGGGRPSPPQFLDSHAAPRPTAILPEVSSRALLLSLRAGGFGACLGELFFLWGEGESWGDVAVVVGLLPCLMRLHASTCPVASCRRGFHFHLAAVRPRPAWCPVLPIPGLPPLIRFGNAFLVLSLVPL